MEKIHNTLLVLIFLFSPSLVASATFENVTVQLTTLPSKLFVAARPLVSQTFIQSSDTIGEHVNFQPLEFLKIYNARIPTLKENSLSNLPGIERMAIISSGIKEVEAGTFKNVPRLQLVSLEGNSITEIKNGVFTGLPIQYLLLSKNEISRIEAEAFNNMTQLTTLTLNSNRISRWNGDWFLGTPVGYLYMSDNLLEEIPANAFSYVTQFKIINYPMNIMDLSLARNRIRRIDKDAFRHINGFGTFNLSHNELTTLPKKLFSTVRNANSVDFSNNDIANIDGVFDDINVYQLILTNNSLSCFPLEVFDVSRLIYVFVDGNHFTCECVHMWKKVQMKHGVWALYNIKRLEDDCVEKS